MTDRGLSDLIGYILVFSLVAMTVGVVSVAGVSSLEDAKDAEQASNAERAFDVLADNVADLHQAAAPNRATEISLSQATLHTGTTATMNVSGWETGGSANFSTGPITSDVLVWESTREPDTKVVYAFGTVLRSQRDGGVVVRPSPFQFDDGRTVVPIVRTRSRNAESLGGGIVRVRSSRSVPVIYHRGDAAEYDNLWVNVTTVHAHTWDQYLSSSPRTNCVTRTATGDHQRVTCELQSTDELYVIGHPIDIALER